MPESYDVTTPLGKQVCDTKGEVREHIAAYMETEGADINRVEARPARH